MRIYQWKKVDFHTDSIGHFVDDFLSLIPLSIELQRETKPDERMMPRPFGKDANPVWAAFKQQLYVFVYFECQMNWNKMSNVKSTDNVNIT